MHYFHNIDPIAFSIGPLSVHWYGLMYLFGIGIGYWLGTKRLAQGRLPVSPDDYSDLIFYLAMGVILGGRIGYMLFYDFDEFVKNPLMIVKLWEGGMSFHGGFLGVMLACWLWTRKHGIKFWDTMDFVSPLVPFALGLGRLGNYIGGELWGRHSEVSWAMIFPKSLDHISSDIDVLKSMAAQGLLEHEARHPSQLYQVFIEGVFLFALVWLFSRTPRARYAVSGVFALGYGVTRFLVEFFREPDAHLGFIAFDWMSMGQVLSLPVIALGLILLWKSRGAPVAYPGFNNTNGS